MSQQSTAPRAAHAPDLERLLGDPHEDGPFGYTAILADDDARRLNPFAEAVLDEWKAATEFVPVSLGGRWSDTGELVTRLRPVFRRDPAVGLGFGLTTLMAAVHLWVAGDDDQKVDVARRLMSGQRIAVAYHELDHGNDLLHNECSARASGDGWVVHGGKQVINNIDRAESVLIMARTRDGVAARRFSLLLWHKTPKTRAAADTSRRVLTVGMRGCAIGAVRFDGVEIPSSCLIGADGAAAETALKAFQITRAIIPALAVGAVEAALHETIRYARARELYGGCVLDIPHARSLFADALADTLLADALSAAVVRSLHDSPRESFLLSAVSKYLAPQLLLDAMQQLSVVAGSTFYARIEPFGILEKFLRDLAVVPIGHAGSMSCLMTILPALPAWARRSEKTGETDLRLFSPPSACATELDFGALGLGPGFSDPLGAALLDERIREAVAADAPSLGPLVAALGDGFIAERAKAGALPPEELTATASSEAFDVARRITLYLAAGAVLGSWMAARELDGVASDPLVTEACLRRVLGRIEGRQRPLPDDVVERLVAHGEASVDASVSIGLQPVLIYR